MQHTQRHYRRGLNTLKRPMFMHFLSIVLKLRSFGLQRRAQCSQDCAAPLPERLFENLLYTVRDAGFQAHEVGGMLPDGRAAWDADPRKPFRRLGDDLQLGCVGVADTSPWSASPEP
jgi:hypothetical protein